MRTRTTFVALAVVCFATAVPASASDNDWERVVDITFPTVAPSDQTPIVSIGGTSYGFIDDFEHGRGNNSCGGIHRATDIFGEHDQPVFAAMGGVITFMPDEVQSYGWMIRIAGDDGLVYNYVHLGHQSGPREGAYAPGLSSGDRVERGQHIGYLGSSGNANEAYPHLHFEIVDPDLTNPWNCGAINPYNSLVAALDRGAVPTSVVDRVFGPERVATAAALSATAFPGGAEHAVLASARSAPDALVAGPLAAALGGPVLTTYPDEPLHPAAAAELDRLGVERVTIVTSNGDLSQAAADLVDRVGLPAGSVDVIEAATPYAASALVAERVRALTGTDDVLLALGSHPDENRSWPDALTAAYHGAVRGQPVLLVAHDEVPAVVRDALGDVDTATIIGGTAAVSPAHEQAIAQQVGAVRRLYGPNRYGTAAAAAGDLLEDGAITTDRLWAATGRNFADALASSSVVAKKGELLVLVDGRGGTDDDAPLDWWLDERPGTFTRARVIGGTAAVSDAALQTLVDRIR